MPSLAHTTGQATWAGVLRRERGRGGGPGAEVGAPSTRPRVSVKGVWVMMYGLVAVLPLGAVLAGSPPPGQGIVLELGSALGIVALSLLALQLILPARLGAVTRPLGADVAVRLHRRLADVLVAAIAAHVALVVIGDPSNLACLEPLGAPWRAQAAVGACVALAALIGSSIVRRRLRLAYGRWRGLHVTLGLGALVLGVLHAIGVDRYLTSPAGVLVSALAAGGLLAVLELRLLRRGGWP